MKRIGIVTSSKELNYGAILQAYAMQKVVEELGYKSELLWWDNQKKSHHDVRIRKVLSMSKDILRNPKRFVKTIKKYNHALKKQFSDGSICFFEEFEFDKLNIKYLSYSGMKKYTKNNDVIAVICGSDQIWDSHALYVDPFYYLRFAPREKRIAYAPSIGKSTIPKYNLKKIIKYISEIDYLSVREYSAKLLLEQLTGKAVTNVCDPSFLLTAKQWQLYEKKINIKEDYVLLYFLDDPSESFKKQIRNYVVLMNIAVYALPYVFDYGIDVNYIDAGPAEFLFLIRKAKLILTDSFHGTAFSINYQKPFLTYSRQYGVNEKQESRILDLLRIAGLEGHYINEIKDKKVDELLMEYEDGRLQQFIYESKNYLVDAIKSIKKEDSCICE
ncbi:MAG: polysaccharide pyruvyl transferase family protein [Pleomorphochaeta sp.]